MEKLTLICFTKYEAQQHDIFVEYLIRNKIYKSTKKHVPCEPHPTHPLRENPYVMLIKLMPCSV